MLVKRIILSSAAKLSRHVIPAWEREDKKKKTYNLIQLASAPAPSQLARDFLYTVINLLFLDAPLIVYNFFLGFFLLQCGARLCYIWYIPQLQRARSDVDVSNLYLTTVSTRRRGVCCSIRRIRVLDEEQSVWYGCVLLKLRTRHIFNLWII